MHDDDAALERELARIRNVIHDAPAAPPAANPTPPPAGGITINGGTVQNAVNGTVHIGSLTQNL
jgi:hypothetical protein